MSVEWYAPLVLLIGLALWLKGSVLGSVIGVLFFSLFGGGAALLVGAASIQPVYLFLVFLLGHVLLSMMSGTRNVNMSLKVNGWLAFFSIYGAVTALILPKLFLHAMVLPPVLINNAHSYYVAPVGPSKQNITTAIYLIGTFIASVGAGIAAADPKSRQSVVTWSIVIAWVHIGFGVLGVIANKVGAAHLLEVFRNAKYAQLVEANEGYLRINGIFPEPSEYGSYAFFWLVFITELWMRNVRPRATGPTAIVLFLIVVACTSSSTYAGLALYGMVMLARWILAPGGLKASKVVIVVMGGLTGLCAVLALAAFIPEVAAAAARIFASFTSQKLQSSSGEQRLFWAQSGFKAFFGSYGLGVGAGTFRCSSLLLAILGSMGVIGAAAFAAHVLRILRPVRASTYRLAGTADPVGVAAAWGACLGLTPSLVAAPTPDPDIQFAIFGGLALGWRFLSEGARVRAAAQVPVAPRGMAEAVAA